MIARAPDGRSRLRRAAGWARHALRRARWSLEDRRLASEGRRGVLGPAHRAWRSNSVAANRDWWDRYDWRPGGEEWTASAAWKAALVEGVLCPWIAQGTRVLEIGPGGGRWSVELAERASTLVLVDVSEAALESCRSRLAGRSHVSFVLGDGRGLGAVGDRSIDAIWSFDVFVHIAPLDLAAYLEEFERVLADGGVAVIHHADGRNRGRLLSRHGWRAPMSRELIAALARSRGLEVRAQFDRWGEGGSFGLDAYGDAISVLGRPAG
jgi:SAM-dependent methyltransferase